MTKTSTETAETEAKPGALPSFTFTTETTPAIKRNRPNAFTDAVASLEVDSGRGLGFEVPEGVKLSVIRSQLDRAAASQETPVSISWVVTPKGAEVGPAHVHISAVKRRHRAVKADDTATDE